MSERETKISIQNVFKIFGPEPESVLPMVREGASKEEVLEKTGHTIGIRDVSLDIASGEIFVIMGLSGSGKSTLIRHINRLIEPTAGRILVDGDDVIELSQEQLREWRRFKMSMVFQRFALLPHKTVIENVMSGLHIRGTEGAEARERAEQQIGLVGLSGFENQYPSQLSGGMQQRVGLARALATDADVLLMDEAFSALDPLIRNDMQDQLIEIQQELHRTIVFITHDLDEALRIGDQIAVLKDGELRQFGTPDEIITSPADDYVRRFVKDVNRARCVSVGTIAEKVPSLAIGQGTFGDAYKLLGDSDLAAVFIVDEDGKPVGAITPAMAETKGVKPSEKLARKAPFAPVETVEQNTVIEEMIHMTVATDVPPAVVDGAGRLVGAAPRKTVISSLVRPEEDEEAAA